MIRQVLALLLIVTTVSSSGFAQTAGAENQVTIAPPSESSRKQVLKIVRRENKLRRGHDAEFAILLSAPSIDCLECVPTLLGEGDRPLLKSLQLDPLQGLSVQYAKPNARGFGTAPAGKLTYTQAGPAILLKLHADKTLPAGDYLLRGKATLWITHQGKTAQEKEFDVAIPVSVVEKNAAATNNPWPYLPYSRNGLGIADAVLAFTILLPLTVLCLAFMVACSALTNDCF